jgi:ABC-type nitrate/sulfonate/bicarbonate transport system permease component
MSGSLSGAVTRRLVTPLVLPVLLLVAYHWWASSAANPYFPTLPAIVTASADAWWGEGWSRHVVPSLRNLFAGFGLGTLIGVALGTLLGRVPVLQAATGPAIGFLLAIPPVALLPVFLLALGVGARLQIGVIVFAVALYLTVCTADAVRAIEPVVLDVCAVYRVRGPRRWVVVLLPAVLPQLLAALRVALSLAVLVMVVSEFVGASRGIGAYTLLAQQSFAYRQMWAGMVLVAALGVSLNALFSVLERTLLTAASIAPSTGARP